MPVFKPHSVSCVRDYGCFPEVHSCNLLLILLYRTGFSVPFRALPPLLYVTTYLLSNGGCCSHEFDSAVQVLFQVKCWEWDIFFSDSIWNIFRNGISSPAHWVFLPGSCGIGQGPGPGDMYEATKRDVKDFCDCDSAVSCSPQCRDATPQLGHLPMRQFSWQLNSSSAVYCSSTTANNAFKGAMLFIYILSYLQYGKVLKKVQLHFLFWHVCHQLLLLLAFFVFLLERTSN